MIVVDVETSGLYPSKHSILSIGAVDFENPSNIFYEECRIWDGAEIDSRALEVNGFKRERIVASDKPSLFAVMTRFIEWVNKIEKITFAGHNPEFDLGFLRASAERYNLHLPFGRRAVDLHSVCFAHYLKSGGIMPLKDGRSDINLDKVLAYVGLPAEPAPHVALNGAKLEAEAFSRIIHGIGLMDEYNAHRVPSYLIN